MPPVSTGIPAVTPVTMAEDQSDWLFQMQRIIIKQREERGECHSLMAMKNKWVRGSRRYGAKGINKPITEARTECLLA